MITAMKQLMETQISTVNKKRIIPKKVLVFCAVLVAIFILIYPTLYVESINAAIRDNGIIRVKIMLALPGDVNYRWYLGDVAGRTPLEVAGMEGNTDIMALLLLNGAKPNNDPQKGFGQPIEYVFGRRIYEGLFDRTKLLVESGADLSIRGSYDAPIIHRLMTRPDYLYEDTLEAANAEVLNTLIYVVEHGASVTPNHPGDLFLTNVVQNKNYGVLAFLFDKDIVDINAQEPPFGETAMMRAAKLGNLEMVDFLLSYGADKTLQDNEGKTALDHAIEGGHTDIVLRLKEGVQ